MDFDIRDLQAIAGLASMSGDQNASAAARQFLAEQSLQERRIKAQEQIERARNAIQTSQFDKDLAFRTSQAGAEQSRFEEGMRSRTRERAEDRATNEFQFGAGLEMDQKRLTLQKAQGDRAAALAEKQYRLDRYRTVQDAFQNFLRASRAATGGTGQNVSMPDALKNLTGTSGMIDGFLARYAQGDKDALAQAQNLAQAGYLVMGGNGQPQLTPQGKAAFDVKGHYDSIRVGLPDDEIRGEFDRMVESASFVDKAEAGLLSPQDVDKQLTTVAQGLTDALLSGRTFTQEEQRANRSLWQALPTSMDKTAALEGIAARTAVQLQTTLGFDDSRAAEIKELVDQAMMAAAENDGYDIARDFAVKLDRLPGQNTRAPIPGLMGGIMPGITGGTNAGKTFGNTPPGMVFNAVKPVAGRAVQAGKKAFGREK